MDKTENIVNLITGNVDAEEKKKVLSDIRTSAESLEEFYKIKAAWALLSSTKDGNMYDTERTYLELQQKIHRKSVPFYYKMNPILRYATIVVLIISISLPVCLSINHSLSGELKYTTVVAAYGQISKIILPDSSVVWLNSGTTLTYNNKYAITNRDLRLDGQAYFDVKRLNDNPLIVSCKDLNVKVLGTKFDVDAYPKDNRIRIVLESGKVQLFRTNDESFDYRLKPGEIAEYDVNSKNIAIEKVKPKEYFPWKDGYLLFDEMPMAGVIEQLERKFNVKIRVKDTEVYKSVFNAHFNKEGLSEILDYISFTCPIRYKLLNKKEEATTLIEFSYHNQ